MYAVVGFWKNRQMDGYGDYPNSRFCPVASNNIDNNSAAEVRLVKLSTQNFEPGKNPGEEGSLEHEISPEQTSIENERQLLCQPSALPVSSLGACRLRKSERPAASLRSCFALALLFKVQDVTASSIHLPGLTRARIHIASLLLMHQNYVCWKHTSKLCSQASTLEVLNRQCRYGAVFWIGAAHQRQAFHTWGPHTWCVV